MYLNTKINTGIKLMQVFKYHFMSICYTRTIWPSKLQLKPKILIIMNYLIKEPIR